MKCNSILLLVLFLFSCDGDSGTSTGNGLPSEPVTDQTVEELLINGILTPGQPVIETIETIWMCSTSQATVFFGLVFLDEPDSRDVGLLYTIDGENVAFFWSVEDDGRVILSAAGPGALGSLSSPEFSNTVMFISNEVSLLGGSFGETACVKEIYTTPPD